MIGPRAGGHFMCDKGAKQCLDHSRAEARFWQFINVWVDETFVNEVVVTADFPILG